MLETAKPGPPFSVALLAAIRCRGGQTTEIHTQTQTPLILLDRSRQPGWMNHHLFPVVYKSQLLKLVHEIGNSRTSGSDHGRRSVMRNLRYRNLLLILFPKPTEF